MKLQRKTTKSAWSVLFRLRHKKPYILPKSLQILHRLRDGCASLNEIYRDCRSRSEVVAAFMSILELCSMGSIHITRGENDYSLEFVGGDIDSILDKIVE